MFDGSEQMSPLKVEWRSANWSSIPQWWASTCQRQPLKLLVVHHLEWRQVLAFSRNAHKCWLILRTMFVFDWLVEFSNLLGTSVRTKHSFIVFGFLPSTVNCIWSNMELPGAANQEVDSTHTHTHHTQRDFQTSWLLWCLMWMSWKRLHVEWCGYLHHGLHTHTHRIARPPRDLAQGFRASDLSFLSLLSSFIQFLTSIGPGIK